MQERGIPNRLRRGCSWHQQTENPGGRSWPFCPSSLGPPRAAEEGAGGASSPPVSTPQVYQAAKPQTSPLISQETRDAGGGPLGC